MVKVKPLLGYIPKNPSEFCTNPYDVISVEEKKELKENPNSLIHLILPDGTGDEIYLNASKAWKRYIKEKIVIPNSQPAFYLYQQTSPTFSQEGLIAGVSLIDYEEGRIIKHEHTRKKPLEDRTKHIRATNVAAGLVWTVFKRDNKIIDIFNTVKQNKEYKPIFDFEKYGYRHKLWQIKDEEIQKNIEQLFKDKPLFIADGHHRAASAAEYRKLELSELKNEKIKDEQIEEKPWQYLLTYIASDDQIRILPYNRVIKKLPMLIDEFIKKLEDVYSVEKVETAFNPKDKHEIAMCCENGWYRLKVKETNFENKRDELDVAILQDRILSPILGIKDPRANDNIFFVGGITDPREMEKYVKEMGNAIFFNLFPVSISDLEIIAENGGVMPPKSTWFDPKLLSGLVLHSLK